MDCEKHGRGNANLEVTDCDLKKGSTMSNSVVIKDKDIQNSIYTIRGVQVMLDEALAEMYGVETRVLNQAVKRNIGRFPAEFMYPLTEDEVKNLRSQIVTSSYGGRRYFPNAFTEQGVAMLSAVLRSDTAVKISVQIMQAFVGMRRFLLTNAQVFQRLDSLELKQIHTDQKIDKALAALENRELQPKQGIFFDGQVFDAWQFVSKLVKSAEKSIVLIDNYVDESILTLFAKRKRGVSVEIYTKKITKQMELDVRKFNEQYPPLEIKELAASHDRFLIIDKNTVYHIGASLKDLGKKWFAFSRMDMEATRMLDRLDKLP